MDCPIQCRTFSGDFDVEICLSVKSINCTTKCTCKEKLSLMCIKSSSTVTGNTQDHVKHLLKCSRSVGDTRLSSDLIAKTLCIFETNLRNSKKTYKINGVHNGENYATRLCIEILRPSQFIIFTYYRKLYSPIELMGWYR